MPAFNYPALFLGILTVFGTITLIVIAYSAYKKRHWGLMIFSICCCVLALFISLGTFYENPVIDVTCAQCGYGYHSNQNDHCPVCGCPAEPIRCEFCDKVILQDYFYCPYCGMSKAQVELEVPNA